MEPTLLPRQAFRLLVATSLWAGTGLLLALALPWAEHHGWPTPGDRVPLALTGLLIVANLAMAVRVVGRTGRVVRAAPFTLAQVALFGVLSVQVGCHLGMAHFRWDRLPRWWDWLASPLLQAARAADLLGLIDAFAAPLDTIRPASPLTVALFAAHHLLFRLFFAALAVEALRDTLAAARGFLRRMPAGMRSAFLIPASFLVFGVAALLFGAFLAARDDLRGGAPGADLTPRLLRQALHTIDLADLAPLLAPRPPRQPGFRFLTVAGVFVRLGLVIGLAHCLHRFRRHLGLRLVGGFGLPAADLEAIHRHHPRRALRVLAARQLFIVSLFETERLRACWVVALASAVALPALTAALAAWPGQAGRDGVVLGLAGAGVTADAPGAERALRALRRLGPYAGRAAPILGAGLAGAGPARQRRLVAALGDLGPDAVGVLAGCREGRPHLAVPAVTALGRIGPAAVPALIAALDAPAAATREAAGDQLRGLGRRGVGALMGHLSRDNAPRLVPLLEEIDPLWYLRDPGGRAAREVRTARIALALLLGAYAAPGRGGCWARDDPTRIRTDLHDPALIAPHLLDLGPCTAAAIPVLVARLADDRTSYGACELLHGIEQTGPHGQRAVADLVRLLPRQPRSAKAIRASLDRMEPRWREK